MTKKIAPKFIRKRIDTEEPSNEWLLTYCDAITLIMTFLVLLLSVSIIDQSKYEQVIESIKETGLQQDNQFVSPFEVLKENLDDIKIQQALKEEMTVTREPKGITIELASSSLYQTGSAKIQPKSIKTLQQVVEAIKAFEYDNYQIEIEGHTDNVAIHTPLYPSNWELSVHRATNIVRYLANNDIDPKRLKAAGYADTRPKVNNLDENGQAIAKNQAMNRRILIHILRKEQ